MSPTTRITLLIEPPRNPLPPMPGVVYTPTRQSAAYDRFAAELQAYTPARIEVRESFLRDAPPGMVLLHAHQALCVALEECAQVGLEGTAGRVFLLNASPRVLVEDLETFRFAGGIGVDCYLRWLSRKDESPHLYGPRSLAPAPALRIADGPIQTEHYAAFVSDVDRGLPALLARYLTVYWDGHASAPAQ